MPREDGCFLRPGGHIRNAVYRQPRLGQCPGSGVVREASGTVSWRLRYARIITLGPVRHTHKSSQTVSGTGAGHGSYERSLGLCPGVCGILFSGTDPTASPQLVLESRHNVIKMCVAHVMPSSLVLWLASRHHTRVCSAVPSSLVLWLVSRHRDN